MRQPSIIPLLLKLTLILFFTPILIASTPVYEGVEVEILNGAGYYPSRFSIDGGTTTFENNSEYLVKINHRQVGAGITARWPNYGFFGRARLLMGGYSYVETLRLKPAEPGEEETFDFVKYPTFSQFLSLGYEGDYFAAEFGALIWKAPTPSIFPLVLPLPLVSIRSRPTRHAFIFAEIFAEPLLFYSPARIGVGYHDERFRVSIATDPNITADVYILKNLALGGSVSYFGEDKLGKNWAAFGAIKLVFTDRKKAFTTYQDWWVENEESKVETESSIERKRTPLPPRN